MKRWACPSHLRCQDLYIIENNWESSWRLAPKNDRLSHDLRSLFFKGGGRREKSARRAHARQPRTPLFSLLPSPYSLLYAVGVHRARQMPCLAEDREGFTQGSRGICRARRAHARQPRTTFLSLLPSPYLLHSSPYSLLYPKYGAHLIESADHVLSELFNGGACFREALLMHIT